MDFLGAFSWTTKARFYEAKSQIHVYYKDLLDQQNQNQVRLQTVVGHERWNQARCDMVRGEKIEGKKDDLTEQSSKLGVLGLCNIELHDLLHSVLLTLIESESFWLHCH